MWMGERPILQGHNKHSTQPQLQPPPQPQQNGLVVWMDYCESNSSSSWWQIFFKGLIKFTAKSDKFVGEISYHFIMWKPLLLTLNHFWPEFQRSYKVLQLYDGELQFFTAVQGDFCYIYLFGNSLLPTLLPALLVKLNSHRKEYPNLLFFHGHHILKVVKIIGMQLCKG